ncbi:hypothetical protein K474DRAFT_1773388 [Panus rudis PR-1116 ss-1]|nr:hypothetical protein K474DRAFT_1773388 [Panus rudis PR-1116 ss-1]
MPPPANLCQVGGFRAHTWEAKPKLLAEQLWSDQAGGLDLILGITPSGATYLYLPAEAATQYRRLFRRDARPVQSTGLVSLSPIRFSTIEALTRSLEDRVSKTKKGRAGTDNSRINMSYKLDELTKFGIVRGLFEKQRLLLRYCTGQISDQESPKFAIQPAQYAKSVRLVSFYFNIWERDSRPRSEREDSPIILDIGWSEFRPQTQPYMYLEVTSTAHIVVAENSLLKNPRGRAEFVYGDSLKLPQAEVSRMLQQFLSSNPGKPTIIMFHDQVERTSGIMSKDVLRTLGVDTTSWITDLDVCNSILCPAFYGSPYITQGLQTASATAQRNHKDVERDVEVGPSVRSPANREPLEHTSHVQRSRSPAPTGDHSSDVHIVDVRDMLYQALRQEDIRGDSVYANARMLGVDVSNIPPSGQNAGNDSRLMAQMWYAMASGNAFIEQKTERWPHGIHAQPQHSTLDEPPSTNTAAEQDEDDSDVDPNDAAPQPVVQKPKAALDPYELLEMSDYEDEDSDDD